MFYIRLVIYYFDNATIGRIMNQAIPLIIQNHLSFWSGRRLDGERMSCLRNSSKTDNNNNNNNYYLYFLYVLMCAQIFVYEFLQFFIGQLQKLTRLNKRTSDTLESDNTVAAPPILTNKHGDPGECSEETTLCY